MHSMDALKNFEYYYEEPSSAETEYMLKTTNLAIM